MAQAYTAPDWSTGEGISPSNLQSISNTLEGIVQGTDKAIHNIAINGNNLVATYVDGTSENFSVSGVKGIAEVTKSSSGNVDTYTIIYTDGTTYSFTVTNGGGGGSSVIANPTLIGDEAALTALEVDGTKYKVAGGGGNADKIELTKAEYDALPDSKLTDGKMYFVTDWNKSGDINFAETKTNRQFLGKDVYVKAYPFTIDIQTNGKSVTSSIVPNLADIESFIDAYYIQNNTSGKTFSKLACYFTDAATLNIRSMFGISANANGILVLEYTRK